MRLFISGSAPLLAETFKRVPARTGHAILERYGMTETGMLDLQPARRRPHRRQRAASPCPASRCASPTRRQGAARRARSACIEVRGPNVFKGYWRMPEKTAAEFRADGFFITGDVGRIDERGYVYIVGRAKDLIISRRLQRLSEGDREA